MGRGRPVARLRVARCGASLGTGLHRPYRRHDQGRHRLGAAWRDGRGRRHTNRRRSHGRQGRSPLRQPGTGTLLRHRQAHRLHRLQERERAGQCRLDHSARCHDERRRPDRASRRHFGNTGHRDEEADRLDQRQPRRAAEHPDGSRSLGRPADRSRHRRRPRQRRRRRIGPAVELSGQGRQSRSEHVEHGRHRDHRHGLAWRVADLLRLRHVPGDAGHDRRRRSGERDARRAAEFRSAQRHEQVARHDALLLRERQPAVRQRLL